MAVRDSPVPQRGSLNLAISTFNGCQRIVCSVAKGFLSAQQTVTPSPGSEDSDPLEGSYEERSQFKANIPRTSFCGATFYCFAPFAVLATHPRWHGWLCFSPQPVVSTTKPDNKNGKLGVCIVPRSWGPFPSALTWRTPISPTIFEVD